MGCSDGVARRHDGSAACQRRNSVPSAKRDLCGRPCRGSRVPADQESAATECGCELVPGWTPGRACGSMPRMGSGWSGTGSDPRRATMPLFEKRQYEHFQAQSDGFVWKGAKFHFGQIVGLLFRRVSTTQRINFVKVGVAKSATLIITVDSGQGIILDFDESGFIFGVNSDKAKDLSNLQDVYLYLSEKSFPHRLGRYLEELREKGFYTHDGCRFYPRNKIVFRGKEFPLATTDFFRGYGYVEMRKANPNWVDKLKREISLTKLPQFSTLINADIIMHLLDVHFGLRWSS
jgi:hypothetical protein